MLQFSKLLQITSNYVIKQGVQAKITLNNFLQKQIYGTSIINYDTLLLKISTPSLQITKKNFYKLNQKFITNYRAQIIDDYYKLR